MGSGVGLCTLAMYQRLFDDDRYAGAAKRLAEHLISEINDQGEFRYYHVYLDQPVAWQDNQKYFSFYYPGEAILGLSQYCQHVCKSEVDRQLIFDRTHRALRFLLRDRPQLHKEHDQTLPADSWLMMGINDLWDIAEFRQDTATPASKLLRPHCDCATRPNRCIQPRTPSELSAAFASS